MSKSEKDEEPTDVLAAEEFPVGDADAHDHAPAEAPHDVLAADEFAVPGNQSDPPDGPHSHPYGAGAGPVEVPKPALAAGLIGVAAATVLTLRRCLRRTRPGGSDDRD